GGSNRAVTVNRFFYPLHLYDADGRHLRDFGEPPPSWRPPGRPERGAFIGLEGWDRLEEWLHAMTVISSVAIYRDSAILVVHAEPEPQPTSIYAQTDTLLDVYSIEGEKLLEDVPVPGRVLEAKDYLYVLEAEPPAGWVVGVYRLRTESLGW
ncbi:MAG TPA: hypothetical protein VK966_02790, partial [Longimicrobiales bacterium]|nr:hypothetical protein [Longimicrobiales bacterium]